MNEDESPTHAFLKTLSTPESFKLGSWTTLQHPLEVPTLKWVTPGVVNADVLAKLQKITFLIFIITYYY